MAEILVEGRRFFERCFVPVDASVQVALFHELSEEFSVGPFSGTNDRGPNGNAVRFHSPKNVIDDFLNGSSGHLFSASWTVRFSNSRPKKAEIVLDLRHGCHGGARIVTALFLVDGNGGRKSLNGIAVCFLHLSDELARVRGQALNVPPLAFCVEGIKGKTRFA